MFSGWQLSFTGWPWWLVLPLAALAVWLLLRLHRRELNPLAPRQRRILLILRGTALALLILFYLEPALTRRSSERVLPAVAVLLDQSGSMALLDEQMSAGAKLGEAIGLGLLPDNARQIHTNAESQSAADLAVITNAPPGSPILQALTNLSTLSRFERGARFIKENVLPSLEGKARVRIFGMDAWLSPLELNQPARLLSDKPTAFNSALTELGRAWPQEYIGGVLLVSDGRQTAGGDAVPVIRSLNARGAVVSAVMVGDQASPPDAVIAEVSGAGEVFVGENVPLTVRYRVTGSKEMAWDIVVSEGGKDLERRTVQGTGQWQYETFAFAATNSGLHLYQARIEAANFSMAGPGAEEPGQVTLELWRSIPGQRVAEFVENAAYKRRPGTTTELSQLEFNDKGDNYGARIRGFLRPPQTGNYIFWIASDDGSELWLSPSEKPDNLSKVASAPSFAPKGSWTTHPTQRSAPITMQAGQPRYFEVLHKEGSSEDYLVIGWELPDGTLERPIPGTRIMRADDATRERLTSRLQALAAESASWKEASLGNNRAEFSVSVSEDPIKVLLVDSTPRWESRYLAAMFERDRRVSFTRRYHSILIDDPTSHLLPRTQAEWDSYDMVCLGDLDSTELPPEQQTFLANFVARRGGFLVCVAGPRGLPRAFSLGTVANLLPVRGSLQGSRDPEPVSVSLTPAGAGHPITQILNDAQLNAKMWPMLPQLQWLVDGVVPKPGAEVLLQADNPARTPIVAIQRYGAGRILWMGTEESWRWRDRLGERVHQTFWLQVMRWGLAGRLRGHDLRLQVGLDRSLLAPGDAAEFRARASDAKGEPLPEAPTVRVQPSGDNTQATPIPMSALPEATGIWRLPVADLDPGIWRVTISHPSLPGVEEVRELSVRDQTGLEGIELAADLPALQRMANAGGHRAVTLQDSAAALREFSSRLKPRTTERRQTIRLWNNYISLAIVIAALGAEWMLRKRHGLP